ncbi:MAG TPA: CHAT domain-containing protein, partial [Cyclobacteriaceae bacterium]|nr:CHAT domain-containing protein [Cyclobacteriaceae bacterium]
MQSGIQAVNSKNYTQAKSSFNKALAAPALSKEAAYYKGIMYYQVASHFVLRSMWKDALPYLETSLIEFDKNPQPYTLLFKLRAAEFAAITYGDEMFDDEKAVNLLQGYAADFASLKREHRHHAAAFLITLAKQSSRAQVPADEYRAYAEMVIAMGTDFKSAKYYQAQAYNIIGNSYVYSILPPERAKMKVAFEKGIALAKEIDAKDLEMVIKGNYATSLYSEGKTNEAVKIMEETAQYELNNKKYIAAETHYNNIGGILYFDGQYKRAIPYLSKAIEIIESQIQNFTGEDRLNMRNSLASAYQFLSLCNAAIGDAQALYKAQNQERAMVLAESISTDRIKTDSKLEDFQKLLAPDEYAIIYSQGPPGEIAINLIAAGSAKAILHKDYRPFNEVKAKYLDRINANAESRPGYKPTSGKSVQGTFYENKQENKLDQKDWEQIMDFTRRLLTNPIPARQFVLEDLLQAYHDILIKPILNSVPAGSKLIFYPDGLLNFLPFETLLDGQKKSLVQKFDIRYGQSPEVSLLIASRNHGPRSKALLAMGGAIYEEMAESAEAIRSLERLVNLQNKAVLNAKQNKSQREIFAALGFGQMSYLEGTLHEVQTLGKIFGNTADIFLGRDMTENRIKQMSRSGELQNYKVIHLATHGYALPEIPQLS